MTDPILVLGGAVPILRSGATAHGDLAGRSAASSHPTSAITGLDAALAALQPLDADLTAIAALTTTSYGRGCLALADAPALASYAGIPLLATSGITGALTLAKTGTTARTVTFPDAAITVAGLGLAQSFTALQTFTAGLTVSAGTTALQAVTCTTLTASGQFIALLGNGLSLNGVLGSYDLHSVASGSYPIRLAMAADAITQRSLEIGYYAGDSRAGAWVTKFAVNGYTGGITCASQVIGTDPGGSELLRVGGGVRCTTLTASGLATFTGATAPSSAVTSVVPWISGSVTLLSLISSGAAANEKIWDIRHTGSSLEISCANDAYSASTAALTLTRIGTGPTMATFAGKITANGAAAASTMTGMTHEQLITYLQTILA